MSQRIILVDSNDTVVGISDKLTIHTRGLLHRAFSVLVFNSKNEILMQQRATNKYHSGGLWSNTCCGHPQENEVIEDAAQKRLFEEMGFSCSLKFDYKFSYRIMFENKLIENEIDYVFVGFFDGVPQPNKNEVLNHKWIKEDILKADMALNPRRYTYWFRKIINIKFG